MCIGFAPPIAGGVNAHQPRILPVLHITFQDAIFDQYIPAAWRAFIINSNRAATIGNRAIINDGNAFGGNLLANASTKDRCAFAVKIAFQPMSNRFMKHDTGPACAKNYFHLACGCRY